MSPATATVYLFCALASLAVVLGGWAADSRSLVAIGLAAALATMVIGEWVRRAEHREDHTGRRAG